MLIPKAMRFPPSLARNGTRTSADGFVTVAATSAILTIPPNLSMASRGVYGNEVFGMTATDGIGSVNAPVQDASSKAERAGVRPKTKRYDSIVSLRGLYP